MSRIETDAREVLLRRRRSLSSQHSPAYGAPGAWRGDPGAVPAPHSEAVRRELADIDAALLRIQEGRYGTCQNCGGAMGLQRLRALPEARYCLACTGNVPAAD